MKVLLSICLVLCLALSVNAVRLRTHTKSSSLPHIFKPGVPEDLIRSGLSSFIIIGLDGMIWLESGLQLKPGEAAAIIDLFKNPKKVFASGVTVSGVKYQGSLGDQSSIIGKKGATGAVIAKRDTFIIISTYTEKVKPDEVTDAIKMLADDIQEKENGA